LAQWCVFSAECEGGVQVTTLLNGNVDFYQSSNDAGSGFGPDAPYSGYLVGGNENCRQ